MITVDRITLKAPLERAFAIASDVERWPEFLPHYRWVRMLERKAQGGVVEMAAWRPFGAFNYPTWWVSEMEIEPARHVVRYRHIRGITRGMDVQWTLESTEPAPVPRTQIAIVHRWAGPAWPLIGTFAANRVIGPIFVHGIASRTLAGVKRRAESEGKEKAT